MLKIFHEAEILVLNLKQILHKKYLSSIWEKYFTKKKYFSSIQFLVSFSMIDVTFDPRSYEQIK